MTTGRLQPSLGGRMAGRMSMSDVLGGLANKAAIGQVSRRPDCLVIASRLPRDCLVIASRLPCDCLTIASRLPRDCLTIAS
eukprot:1880617-Prymnesium_polylepis.1